VLGRDAWSLFCAALLVVWGGALALLVARPVSAQAASDEQARIVFLMPALDASSRAQLQDALYAQLSLVDAELVVLDDVEGRDSKELAQAERARAVLWLDTTSPDRWLLHIMDVHQERKVVRRIDAREGQRSAALEAVAVLAREASRGGPLLEESAAAEPEEPRGAEVEPNVPPRAEPEPIATEPEEPQPSEPDVALPPPILRLALFYSGVYFAPESGFSHAAGLSARLDWHTGFFGGLSAAWAALAKPPGPLVVQRVPLGAAIGYRLNAHENLWADLELGLLVELLFRTTRGRGSSQADEMRVMAALAPRLRVEYRPMKLLGFFTGIGLDVALTRPTYKAETEAAETLLSPGLVRPAMEAGVAFYQ
jgi:hypothetical protein